MGRSFFYTCASLPSLKFETKPPVTRDEFLYSCSLELNSKELLIVQDAVLGIPENESVLKGAAHKFWIWNRSLKNVLADARAKVLNIDASAYLLPGDVFFEAENIAAAAVKIQSPLEAELFIMKSQWDYLESLGSGHLFDLDFLVVYSLKLALLERLEQFEEERGYAVYQDLYKKILDNTDNDITIGV